MFNLFSSTPSITTDELKDKLAGSGKITLLDVRTPNEFQGGHIAQAKNVPLSTLEHFKEKHDDEVYVICQSGMRSKNASKILQNKGYDVVNVKGGMNNWNGPVKGGK